MWKTKNKEKDIKNGKMDLNIEENLKTIKSKDTVFISEITKENMKENGLPGNNLTG